MRLTVRVRPGASRNRIDGFRDGALVVRLTAPPVAGQANAALVVLLARQLGVARRDIEILRGQRGRLKVISVSGLTDDAVRARFGD